ncbi:hypothetical protein ACLMJK_001927 [Lecanora helva]
MAPSTKLPAVIAPSQQDQELQNPPYDWSKFRLLDDVLRDRATDPVQRPLMAFPKSPRGSDDFEYHTGKDLDRYTDEAAWFYTKANLATTDTRTVALLGPTNLDWVASLFGLSRAGYTVLCLSPRLSDQAVIKLMQETECLSLVYYPSAQLSPVVDQVKAKFEVRVLPILSRQGYDKAHDRCAAFVREYDLTVEEERFAIILHSSGSTGLPKPIYVKQKKIPEPIDIGPGDRDFVTLPLFHSFAIRVCPARMFERKTWFFPNPNLPMTCESLATAMRAAKPGTMCVVPYVLKLLREQESGIEALRNCPQVMFTGSQCPDDLGDYLVERGVHLVSFIGSTECGFIGASERPPDDKAWNYIRPPPPLMKEIWPKPISEGTFEFVYLKGYAGRIVSNSNDPPDSFHSKDIFSPHKSIPGAWKYIGRMDDRVTLVNGEKVLPLPIEGSIRQAALVKEAVVFGVGKSLPGLLLFRAEAAKNTSDEDFIAAVWPVIEATNRIAEGFSQIGRDMVVPMPVGIDIPTTDKGSIIRAQVYNMFAREIENAYTSIEERSEGILKLDLKGLEGYVMQLGQDVLGPQVQNLDDDLFALGMDSLQAIQIRSMIVKTLDLNGNAKKLSQNAVYEQGTLKNLASHLNNLQLNLESAKEKPIESMRNMISNYSVARAGKPRVGTAQTTEKQVVILTGATGGLGAQVLVQLLKQSNVEKVYCLVRGAKPSSRVKKSLWERHLTLSNEDKIYGLTSDLSQPKLGLDDSIYDDLLSQTTHIIHCAWPVNFQLALSSFEASLKGLQNLINLSLDVNFSSPARLLFCSSISAALGAPQSSRIPEAPIEDLEQVSETGYAQSKLVSEHIVQQAAEYAGANATILRIGQVVGDTQYGFWNDSEAFPLIIRSAVTMGILPELSSNCEWLPVDTLAQSIIEIGGIALKEEPKTNGYHDAETNGVPHTNGTSTNSNGQLVYNLVSPHTFSWTTDLLPALSTAGLSFRPKSLATWLHQLRKLSSADANITKEGTEVIPTAAADPSQNPAIKLVSFFEESFQDNSEAAPGSGIRFETGEAERKSPALKNAPLVIESGLLKKMVDVWMERWREPEMKRAREGFESEVFAKKVKVGDGE